MSGDVLATVLILLSAVIHAVVSALIKAGADKFAHRAAMLIVVGLLAFPFVFLAPLPTWDVWMLLALSKMIHLGYEYCLLNAYKYGDLSLVYPVFRGTAPVITAAGAFVLLSETLSPFEMAALLTLCLGILFFAIERPSVVTNARANRKALLFAVATAVPIAGYTLVDAIGMRTVAEPLTYMAWSFVLGGTFFPALVTMRRPRAVMAQFTGHAPRLLIAGVLVIVTYSLALFAFRIGQTAEIAALRETSVVFAALIGAIFLSEPFGRRRILAALVIAAGAVGLKVA